MPFTVGISGPFSALVFSGEPDSVSFSERLNIEKFGSSVTSLEMSRKSGRSSSSAVFVVYVSNKIKPLHLEGKQT